MKQHYYLVAGKVTFFIGDPKADGNEAATIELNTMVICRNPYVTIKEIGKAQQALQMQTVQKLNEPNMTFVNVVITTFSYLGHMRPDEFQKPADLQLVTPSDEILEKAPIAS